MTNILVLFANRLFAHNSRLLFMQFTLTHGVIYQAYIKQILTNLKNSSHISK